MSLIKTYFKQIDILFFYLSIFTLTQSIKLSSKFLFIALFLGLIKSIYNKNFLWIRKQKRILFFYSIFLIYIFAQGIIIDGISVFVQFFEKNYAPYLIFLFLPIFYQDDDKVKHLPKILIAGILFTLTLILLKSIFHLEFYNRNDVLEMFKLHHLYISLYILFAINYLTANITLKNYNRNLILETSLVFILVLFLLFFKSKAAIVIALLILGFYLIIKVKWSKNKIIVLVATLSFLLIFFHQFFLDTYVRAIDFRASIWAVVIDSIKQSPIVGYGGSKEHLVINKLHFLNGNYDFLDSNYNSHNQYLTFLIKFGFIGLSLIATTFILPIFSLKNRLKREYYVFLFIIGLMAMIESLYNRHHGIAFCTIFLYYYSSLSKFKIKES